MRGAGRGAVSAGGGAALGRGGAEQQPFVRVQRIDSARRLLSARSVPGT